MQEKETLSSPIVARTSKRLLARIYRVQAEEIKKGLREKTNASQFIREAVEKLLDEREA